MGSFTAMSEKECYDIDGGAAITAAVVWGVIKVAGACFGKGLATGAGIWTAKKILDSF